MKKVVYFLVLVVAFGCKKTALDPNPTEAVANEDLNSVARISYSTASWALGAIVPGTVDSKGNLLKAPRGLVFNLGSVAPSTFFKAIAGRSVKTAKSGQFYCLPTTDPSYTNTIKVLNKFGSLGIATPLSSGYTVAIIKPNVWFASTGGVYKPSLTAYSTGTKFPSKAAALGYKDASGVTYKVYLTFGYRVSSSLGIVSTSSVVASGEAFPESSEFKVVNGSTAGTGKRWSGTCLPGSDYPSGSYDLISEIPGTSSAKMGFSNTSFASYLFDDLNCFCGL